MGIEFSMEMGKKRGGLLMKKPLQKLPTFTGL